MLATLVHQEIENKTLIEPYHLALSPSIIVYTLKYETKTPQKQSNEQSWRLT
jgi:hypothetical protein